jgi:hypothetical protein
MLNPDREEDDMADESPPLNREQRRAQKFHRRGAARQDNLQTQRENNSGFLGTPPAPSPDAPLEGEAVSTTQDPAQVAVSGAGGAVEADAADEVDEVDSSREGTHLDDQPAT